MLASAWCGLREKGCNMKHYRVPLVWMEYGHVWVEAESEEEAIEYALGPECPLPEGDYVDDSVEVDPGCCIEVLEVEGRRD